MQIEQQIFPLMVSFSSHRQVTGYDTGKESYSSPIDPTRGYETELLLVSKEDRDPFGKARKVIRYQGRPRSEQ